jgi:diguanylate cyclase (GGDEF)-like protein
MKSIEEKKTQNNVIVKTCYMTDLAYALIRLICIPIFFVVGANILAYISIGSVVVYILYLLILKYKKYYLYALSCGNEFIIYASAITILSGFSTGFYLNIVGLSIVSFFTVYFSFKERKISGAVKWTITSLLICIGLQIYCTFGPVYYSGFPVWAVSVLFGINLVVVFEFIVFYLLIFTKYAMTLENKIKNESRVDQLTKISNRYDLFNYLDSIENKTDYALSIFDIDDFKKVNDTYGHQAGDAVLKAVSSIIEESYDNEFVTVRWGGEEFVLYMPQTDEIRAYEHLTYLRKRIENNIVEFDNQKIKVTVTVGMCTGTNLTDYELVIRNADDRLYYGKRNGKNCVVK